MWRQYRNMIKNSSKTLPLIEWYVRTSVLYVCMHCTNANTSKKFLIFTMWKSNFCCWIFCTAHFLFFMFEIFPFLFYFFISFYSSFLSILFPFFSNFNFPFSPTLFSTTRSKHWICSKIFATTHFSWIQVSFYFWIKEIYMIKKSNLKISEILLRFQILKDQ